MQSHVCVQDWFRCEGTPINVEEDLESLEQIELGKILCFMSVLVKISLLCKFK